MGGDFVHFNIRGLNTDTNTNKSDFIQNELNKSTTKVVNIQETRISTPEKIDTLVNTNSNVFNCFSSNATVNDTGAGILLFVRKTEDILETSNLIPGRLLFVKIKNKVTEMVLNLFSLYGKSNTNLNFATKMISEIDKKVLNDNLENIIVLGDFNFVTTLLDRKSNQFTSTDNIYRNPWLSLEKKIHILDAFRNLYPTLRRYTFLQGGKIPKSRLDRFYISNVLSGKVTMIKHETNPESDHRLLRVSLASDIEIGKSTWVFNNNMLSHNILLTEIRNIISTYKTNHNDFPNICYAWDFMKMEIASASKAFSIQIAKNRRKELDTIRFELSILENLSDNDLTDQVKKVIEDLREKENQHFRDKVKGAMLRAKISIMEEGEINISYYSKLEKRRAEENAIFSLQGQDGLLAEGTTNILKIVKQYYTNLYSKEPEDEALQDRLISNIDKTLAEDDKAGLSREITKDDLKESLKNLNNNKTPGSSGLTAEVYRAVWDDLADFYL